MSRTGLDAETLARSLRARAGDGSIEWVCEPIQTSVLLDIADMLDKNAELRERIDAAHMSRLLTENENESLRELAAKMAEALRVGGEWCDRECIVVFGCGGMDECPIAKELRELGVEVDG